MLIIVAVFSKSTGCIVKVEQICQQQCQIEEVKEAGRECQKGVPPPVQIETWHDLKNDIPNQVRMSRELGRVALRNYDRVRSQK